MKYWVIVILLFLVTTLYADKKRSEDGSTMNNPLLWMLVRQVNRMETKFSKLDVKVDKLDEVQDNIKKHVKDTTEKLTYFKTEVDNLKKSQKSRVDLSVMADLKKQQERILIDVKRLLEAESQERKSEVTNLKSELETDRKKLRQLQFKCNEVGKESSAIKTRLSNEDSKLSKLQKDISQCVKKGYIFRCYAGWKPYRNHCYYFSTDVRTWHQAKFACEQLGGYLTKIEDKAEHDWLKSVLRASRRTYPWIGLNDIAREGQWCWVSDNSLMNYSGWNTGEPNGHPGFEEDCGNFWRQDNWNDSSCAALYTYICEKPLEFIS